MIRGRSARSVEFARDAPHRALALIPVGGELHAHSWDRHTGELVRATSGPIQNPLITPDGQWIWWFDNTTHALWRRPFGTSFRGRLEPPLRLRPLPGTQVLAGGDGTAIVRRPLADGTITVSLLPIGRVRAGAEPVLITQTAHISTLARSRDDQLLAVETATDIEIYRAHSGTRLTTEARRPEDRTIGFAADGSLLLARHEAHDLDTSSRPLLTLTLWQPHSGLRRSLPLDAIARPLTATLAADGLTILLEGVIEDGELSPRVGVFRSPFNAWAPQFIGPAAGTLISGSVTSDAAGAVYGVWRDEDSAERFIQVDSSSKPGHGGYPPVVGGIGW